MPFSFYACRRIFPLVLALLALYSSKNIAEGAIIGSNQESPLAILVDTLYWSNNRGRNIDRIMKMGVDNGVTLDLQNDQGWAPLHFAVAYDALNAVEVFLSHGADVNQVENDQWSPLHFAAYHGNEQIASMLLSKRADPLLRNRAGLLPSTLALQRHPELAAVLAAAAYERAQEQGPGPSEHQFEEDGEYDCEAGIDVALLMDLLRDAKARPSLPLNANMIISYTSGHTPLTVATCVGDVDAVRELVVEMGSNLHYANARSGRGVLHYAVASGSTEMVREVLSLLGNSVQAGAGVEQGVAAASAADGAGMTPLALAQKKLGALSSDGSDAQLVLQREARLTILEALQRTVGVPTETEQGEERVAKARAEEEARRRDAEQKRKGNLAP